LQLLQAHPLNLLPSQWLNRPPKMPWPKEEAKRSQRRPKILD
jgi:hypothetical protein